MSRKWKRENVQRKDIRADKKPKGSAKRTIFCPYFELWMDGTRVYKKVIGKKKINGLIIFK